MKPTGNIVLITGGGSGIGLALARAFLELQNTVIVCGRSLEKLEFAKKEYPDIHTFKCDITRLTKIFLPILMKQPEAAIINVSSGLGITPKESAPVYCGTKAAVHIFSKSLRYQLEKTQVKEVMDSLKKDNYEIRVGTVKLLFLMNRLFPSLAEKMLRGGTGEKYSGK